MKIYGSDQNEESEFNLLSELSLVAEPATLRELASFLYRCADAIEEDGKDWEQEQFESSEAVSPHFVVFNPDVVES